MLAAIRQWVIKTMMKGQTGVVRTLPRKEIIELNTQITAERMMRNGINPEDMKNVNQVENVINQIDTPKVNVNPGITGVKKADVFDIEGNKIPEGSQIMGGKEIKESDAAIKARLDADNKKGIASIKNNKMIDDAIDDASPGFADGDTKYDAELVAENLAERRGLVYDDLSPKERSKIYGEAYDALSRQRFSNRKKPKGNDPEEKADGGRIGLKGGAFLNFIKNMTMNKKSPLQFGKDYLKNVKEKTLKANETGKFMDLPLAEVGIPAATGALVNNQIRKKLKNMNEDQKEENLKMFIRELENDEFYDKYPELKDKMIADYTESLFGVKKADGGRIGYKAGSVDKMRRLILKTIGAGTAGIAGAKSGIFSFGKGAGKEVAKEVAQQTTSSMPPPYFFKLAEKIKMLGDDATATTDRTIAKTLKSKDGKSTYLLEEDVSTGDTIIKKINKEGDEMITDVQIMEFKKGEVVMGKDGKAVKTPDEYEEVTEANARIEGDVFNDPYYSDGIQVDEIIKEVDDKVPSIKYATGGRAGYFKGGLAALKTLLNYFAKEKGTTGSKLLSDINPRKIDSGIKNLMSKEELNQLKENRTEYVKHLLNIIKSDKKFLDNNRELIEETIAQAPIGMEDFAKEMADSIKRSAMKENRLKRLSVYDKVNPDDAIMDVEMMIKNMSTGKDKRALNATGGLAYMLGE